MAEADDKSMLTILGELQSDSRANGALLMQILELLRWRDRRFDEIESRFSSVLIDLERLPRVDLSTA